ncbi:mucin-5AC [Rhynchonycteris naso]
MADRLSPEESPGLQAPGGEPSRGPSSPAGLEGGVQDLPPVLQGPSGDRVLGVTVLPPLRTTHVVRALNPAHNGRVCSTWGDFHYKTFDGDIFRFPGRCNYVFSAHCGAAYEDFNVQLRRGQESNATTVGRVTMKLSGMVLELTKGSVLVNGHPVQLPFSQSGVLVEHSTSYLKVVARLGLVFMWHQDNSLLLELDTKYANQTCGLCGDFNGIPLNEFFSHNAKLTPIEFGNLQKMDGPTEQCQDTVPEPPRNCSTSLGICEELLSSAMFLGCNPLVDPGSYVQACRQDLCFCPHTANPALCVCHTLAEYSRQCAHAGGLPPDWRSPDLCPQMCPLNMQYRECGSPCADTCSNLEHSQVCEDHCVAGCFCPEGTVFDDIGQTGCVPVSQCPCVYRGAVHAPGAVYSSDCTNCTCSGGRWSCRELPCPGTCSVLGGAHFSTFDERLYTVHGDCSYVLAKPCGSSTFTVLAELRRCGLTDSETCLRELTLSLDGGRTVVVVKASGEVLVNQIYTQLPVSAANITLFRPSTFFIIAQTNLGLQVEVQLVPAMQVFLRLAPQFRGLTCGLCGNFNQNQADDFRTLGGVVEGTAAAFANTWKTQAACPNVKNSFEDPCSLSVENEKYAQHWCSRLTDPQGPFAECHAAVNPASYYSNCLFDTCNCEKSEDCLCAALSAYVRACAARGVLLRGWRAGVCTKPMDTCPKSMTYHYNIDTCQPTCRVLSNEDVACGISFVPVDGCTCPQGTFLDDGGKCVPAASCPCYHGDSVVPNGESLHERGAVCTCTQGTLTCIGGQTPAPVCAPPMVYFDCRNATPGDPGAGCQKSCHTLDMDCYSPQCVPGCVCPAGLVADGEGGCIATADCPCVHNEASYQAGQTIRVGCNTCTCKSRMWQCTDEPCLATCAVYGDGHYLTFDGQRYSFNGDCEYTLVQNHCGGNSSAQDAFRVVTENVPCGTTGTTCSKAIKIFLGSYELKLSDGKVEVIEKGVGPEVPYSIRQVGIYLVVDTESGLVLLWDKRTSIFLRLSPEFKGKVCGLCGNFDNNAVNDFTTRSQSVVGDALEFGNSWKVSPSCPDAPAPRDPCTANPYRKSWAQKQCSLINSATFGACHAHVEPAKYYEACVNDACACDSGGDCECFCTAVAAYAQACREVGVCVPWRSPEVCPLFCDYYNPEGQCQWHYQPCGAPCMRTCRNPRGHCLHDTRSLEGCYPKCPPEAPIFDEDNMQCVATCPSPPPPPPCQVQGKSYRPGAVVPSDRNCHSCICTENGVRCVYDTEACVCTYDGRRFRPGDVIYHTTDGTGGCISARCGVNGTIERSVHACSSSTPIPPTTFSFSTLPVAVSSTGPPITSPGTAMSPATTGTETRALSTSPGTSSRPKLSMASVSPGPGCGEECQWSSWLDVSRPGRGVDSGDFDTLDNLRVHGYQVCQAPRAVECQAEGAPGVPLQALGQRVECSPTVGLVCYNRDQVSGLCDNYQIRVLCCTPRACSTSSGPATVTPPATNRTTKARLTPGTTSVLTESSTVSPSPVTTTGPTMSSTTSRIPAPGTSAAVRRTLSTSGPRPVSTTSASVSTTPPGPSEVPGAPTSSGASPISCLQERCTWTGWVDASYPQPGINSGDFDTFQNLRSKGYTFCERPSKVECRAEHFPDTPLALLGQDVVCNNQVGLVCLNRNQLPPICYNYQIRIQCCEWVDVCRETTVSSVTPTEMRSTWSQVTQTAGVSSASTQHRGASSTQVPPTTKEVTPGTTTCRPQCTWTKWFDVDFPSPGPHGGDVETYSNIVRSGEKICRRPEYIAHLECRAENHPEVSIERLGQVVQCDADVGLVCHNRDQPGRFKMCFNYEVRVLCCEPQEGCPTSEPVTVPSTLSVSIPGPTETTSHLATSRTTFVPETSTTSVHRIHTTSAPETSRTPVPKIRTTSAPETSTTPVPRIRTTSAPEISRTPVPRIHTTSAPETSTTQVRIMSTTSAPVTTTTLVSAAETTHPTPGTTTCRPQCTWTKWFDVDFPSPGPHGGDVETYSNIVRSGEKICRRPEYIAHLECRAENHPEVSIERLGQVVQCDPDVGLVCHNRDQPGRFKMCFNYEVRVLCCEPQEGCPTSEPVTVPSTLSVSIPGPTETTSHLATSRTTFVPETSTTSVHRIHTTSAPETSRTPVPRIRTTSAPETSTTPVPRIRTTSAPEISRTPVPRIHTTSAPETSTTQVRIMSTTSAPVTTTTLVSAAETTHPTPGTTTCRPQCTWTKWFDVDFPSPGPHGGDVETYSNIVRSGEKICRRPEYIAHLECRAENHPEVSIERLGQVVQCDPDVGLVCHNRDQPGRFKMCFNYEVRVLCCEPQEGCPTSEPVTVPSTLSNHLCAGNQYDLCAPNPHDVCTRNQQDTGAQNPYDVCTRNQHDTGAQNPHDVCTRNQQDTGAQNPHDVCTRNQHDTGAQNPHDVCTRNQQDTGAQNPHDVCTRNQHDTGAQNPHDICIRNQKDTGAQNPHICTRNQHDTGAQNPHDVCTRNQQDTGAQNPHDVCTRNQHDTGAQNPHDVCTRNQQDTGAQNPHDICTRNQQDTGAQNPHDICTRNQQDTGAQNPHDVCTRNQQDTGAQNPHDVCTRNQQDTGAQNPHDVCTRNQQDTGAQNPHDVCTRNQHDTGAQNPHDICTRNQQDTGAQNPYDVCTRNQHDTAETTQPTPGTTTCRPQCTWTKWFDVDFPSPGPHGGDVETYSNIVRSGEKICRRPEYIAHLECRAENHPEVSIERLGQVVQCDPDVGLVCHNRDQPGRFKMCFNYEVRVLCCEPQEGCPTSEPVTVPSTLSVSIPGPTETTSHLATSRTTFVPETSTTSVHRIHTTSAPETSRTPVPRIHTTSAPETSTTLVPRIHTTSAPETSRTPVPRIRTTSAPETSTTPVPRIRTTSAPETSTTQVRIMSTTSAPVTTTTLVSAAETTHPTPGTTTCRPQCTWTKWFDVDFPSPGPHGGDVETYSNIVRSGEKICRRPEYIAHLECRAENHPEVSIERLGQVVQCDADVGLVCHNRDQPGRFKMCFNYEVRVLCCEPQDGCPTSEIPYMTSSAGSPPTTDFISVVPTLSSPSTPVSSTPACYCSVADKLYPAGSIIYQQADLAGHCYYAVCSVDCHVLRQTGHACPTSASPPTPPTSPAGSSSSAPVPVTTQGCPNAVPPRTRGETWAMPNCSQATCEGNNVITLQPRPCPSVQEPTCANGYPAVKVADEDGCCLHYQCQCVCSGWGDPHYITFDGTYYTFLDNCTYVLVQQIVPVYGHFRVLVDNYFCDAEDGLSCPQSIVVEYRQDRVVLTRKPVRGVMTNEIIFNNKVVSPGFGKDGILVSQIGIKMYVTIPEIGVQVLFTGLVFSVAVPFSKFANNTEGQCGTCTNDPKDDCRLPGGAVVTSCSDMSVHWKVPNPDQPSCHGPPPTAPAVWTTTPPTPCPPSPICQLILSDVFKLCHAVIPPRPYFEGCVFDQCHMTNADVVCSGLELYASLCASHGVCIDWRGQTNHTCPFTCPADKVYRPCGPTNPSFCYGSDSISLMVLQDAGPVMEGCFCPEGMTPFSSTTEVCVPVGCPRCLGPHGEPVEPGHTVSFNCQECTCEGGTWTMTCRPQPCPPPPACPEPGLVPVPVAPQAGLCCPQYTCACNTSYCPTLVGCPEGTRQSLTYEDGACCPHQHCSWTVCSVNGTLYQPGAVVSSSLCETCRCELPGGPPSDTFRISCETQTCNTHCPVGFEYQAQSGQCCGACVQVACVMNTSDSSAHLFYPGESWSDPGNRCETHECERHQNGLVVVTTKKACPPLSCPVDQAVLSKDRCCLTCPQPQPQNKSTCAVYHKDQVIRVQGCSSEGAVRLTYCRGNCGDTTSMYSLEANSLEHRCRCCQELRTSPRDVTLRCADGSRRAFSYTQVEECGCVGQHCEAQDDLGQLQEQGPLQSQDTEGLRRRGAEAQASPLA